MGGAVKRTVAAVTSLGTSEAFQEKPFQDVTTEDRPTAGGGSPLRFSPLTSGIMPATKQTLGQVSGSPPSSDPETGPNSEETLATRGRQDAEKKQQDDAQQAADDLAARTETSQEAWAARKRASGAAERLGIRGRRRTASDTLLGGPQGSL